MLPPPVRTVLTWAAVGVAVGLVGSLAVATLVAAPASSWPHARRLVEQAAVLVVVPVPLGWTAGVAAGTVVAAGRGATGLVVLGALTAVVGAGHPLLAGVPIVLTLAGMSLPGRPWRRPVAGLSIGVAGGLGLLGIPVQALLAARGVPRGLGLVVGALAGFAAAGAVLSRHRP